MRVIVILVFMIVVVIVLTVVIAVQVIDMGVALGVRVAVAGQAVLAALFREGRTQIAARPDPAGARRQGAGVVEAALDPIKAFVVVCFALVVVILILAVFVLMILVRRRVEGNLVVVGAPHRALQSEGQAPGPEGGPDHPGALVVGRAQARFADRLDPTGGRARRHLLVDQIDRPADGAAAIDQGAGAAQNLDAFQQQRLAGDIVVGRHLRGVGQAGAVAEHPHARRGLAPDHWPAGATAKGVRVDAGRSGQGLAQGRLPPMD